MLNGPHLISQEQFNSLYLPSLIHSVLQSQVIQSPIHTRLAAAVTLSSLRQGLPARFFREHPGLMLRFYERLAWEVGLSLVVLCEHRVRHFTCLITDIERPNGKLNPSSSS